MPVISISLLTSCHADSSRGKESHPSSATCQCPSVSAVSAHQCHLPVPINATSMPHISAHLSCLSVLPISASQCHLSMPCQSVPPNSASQCSLSVPVSAAYQCHI
ncbi:unnamed protein product [Staurois parvus]|uniref:Uncharacterized protein n=1 Tax=Staurois parvus TaxID=386267 RepID=A0ABN9GF24_9NEOB|nr:unnamed protein product [Staurois parvus]